MTEDDFEGVRRLFSCCCMFVSCFWWYVQGQKGEPGLILGPDGKPQHIGGLGGAPVGRATTFQPLFGQFVVIQNSYVAIVVVLLLPG